MPDKCRAEERVVGPYNQTLFLGCSVSSFNCNLGWGGDQSTLSVTLVKDDCKHLNSLEYSRTDIAIEAILQNTEESKALYGIGNNPSVFDPNADKSKSLYKNLAYNIKNLENTRDTENILLPADFQDSGKKIVGVYNNKNRFWLGADPGFLGLAGNIFSPLLGFDILGIPVFFRFQDFSFGGLISQWKQNGGSSAVETFDVEIKSFATLLNSCQLIIDKYAGVMCGILPNTNLSVPQPYLVDTSSPITQFSFPDHRANIAQGNMPNAFNIYGYLEFLGYKRKIFGNAGVNDDGMRAQFIYDAIVNILGTPNNINNVEMNRFAPYGGILTRSIRMLDGGLVNPEISSSGLFLTDLGVCPSVLTHDNYFRSRLLLDITEVPRPPKWLRMQGPVISIMQFITEICDGAGFDFFVDFIPPPRSNPLYSGIIKIRTVSRRKQPRKNQIDALITRAANNYGVSSYSKGVEHSDSTVRSMYVGGNQKRLLQVKNTRLAFRQNSLIYDPWANNGEGHWIDYGIDREQLPSLPNQVRMPNVRSIRRYSVRNLGGAAVCSDSDNFNNPVYFTSPASSRSFRQGNYLPAGNLSDGNQFAEMAGAGLGLGGPLVDAFGWDLGDLYNLNNIPLFLSAICPFFGVGFGGLVRKVFFDVGMGQLQVLFNVLDIQSLTGLPLTAYDPFPEFNEKTRAPAPSRAVSPVFLVMENEIRAAGAGFASWLNYCFGSIYTTDISQLVYKGFRSKYGNILNNTIKGVDDTRKDFLIGLKNIIAKANNKNLIVNGRPMQVSLDDLSPAFKTLYHDLEKIHQFFADIANTYYGKQYMIRGLQFAYYRDISYAYDNNDQKILLGTDENNNPIYAMEGTGKTYTNYQPSPDGAWEEPGNWIDDTMAVGGVRASFFCDDTGKISPILGFNASVEKENRVLWEHKQMLWYASLRRFSDSPTSRMVIDYEFVQERRLNDPILNGNHYYMSINHTMDPDEYMTIPYAATTVNWKTAHGEYVPSTGKYKLYARASAEQSIVFLEPYNVNPRIVVKLSSPVYIGQRKNATDTNLDAVMAQDAILFLTKGPKLPQIVEGGLEPFGSFGGPLQGFSINRYRTILRGFSPNQLGTPYGLDYLPMIYNLAYYHQHPPAINETEDKPTIIQKAAMPMFCALPIEFNTFVYGPWINHPGLIASDIFPDSINQISDVENLIGGVKVNVDSSLVPWNFGGMTQLDEAVMLKIADDINYQQFIETGTVQIPGLDNLSLGTIIKYFGMVFDGPIVNSIQVQIGENGVTTTYNFRTYTRKLGLFNKENADRIKAIGQESLKRNKEINNRLMTLASKGLLRVI